MTFETKAERQFTTARTPKHNNRSGKRETSGGEDTRHAAANAAVGGGPESPPRRRHGRPPSPPYDYYYGYGSGGRGPPPPMGRERGYYDYHYEHPSRPHYDRYGDYRNAPPPPRHYYEDYHRERSVSDLNQHPEGHHAPMPHGHHGSHPPGPHTGPDPTSADNNSLRAVSSSFSANESLNNASIATQGKGPKEGGGIGFKHSPGVVTAADSLEASNETNDPPHPPSLSSSKSTPTHVNQQPSPSPQSDSSWRQLQQIASIDTKDQLLTESRSEELVEQKEVLVTTTTEKETNEDHGLEKSISRTSSLSNSPTEGDKFADVAPANSEEYEQQHKAYEARYPPQQQRKHPPLPVTTQYSSSQGAGFDENSPSASTISTKDTASRFFPPGGMSMKPKHPVHLKGRSEHHHPPAPGEGHKRRKTNEDLSPANASEGFSELQAMPSWDKSGWSVCSGMTGMESLIKNDAGGGVLSAFSFGSELSRKREEGGEMGHHPAPPMSHEPPMEQAMHPSESQEESPDKSVKGKRDRKHAHVQFSQSFDQHGHLVSSSRKRHHDGRMAPPSRYRRHEDYPYPPGPPPGHPSDVPPPMHHPAYEFSPPRYRYREYEEDPYYQDYYNPRYYDYRYRPPPPPPHYGYRPPPQEYEYPPPPAPHQGGRLPPPAHARPPTVPSSSSRAPISGSWDKEDDLALMDIMKKHKNVKNWDPIAKKLNRGKSAKECHDRWTRFLKPGSRKGQWTEAEDRIVFDAVSNSIEDPFTRWSDLAQQLPGRVGKQVRDRWVNHLNPNINHLPFSKEDDLKLWEGHCALGKRWVEISAKYFKSTRSENHIKNRWYSASFKKFITAEFGPDAYRIGNEQGGMGAIDLPGMNAASAGQGEAGNTTTDDASKDASACV